MNMNTKLNATLKKFQKAMARNAEKALTQAQKTVTNRFVKVEGGIRGAAGFVYR
jgi:exonuclease VII small subunit